MSQIQRIMAELGIESIPAYSPQAKGRIERLWGTLQDRLTKELPATGTVMIDVPAQPAGSKLFYSCSMGMYSGVIVFDG
jgi:hypothetical protein